MKREDISVTALVRSALIVTAHALLIVIMALFFSTNMGYIYTADGSSMKDTIADDDVLLVNKLAYSWSEPRRFDLIFFKKKNGYEGVKRIVGLPGEKVSIKDGNIYINDAFLEQEYWNGNINTISENVSYTLGMEEFFVLGDNPSFSEDSRSENVGMIIKEEIQGIPWFCCYPFTRLGVIK